jgi:hypothetical protein
MPVYNICQGGTAMSKSRLTILPCLALLAFAAAAAHPAAADTAAGSDNPAPQSFTCTTNDLAVCLLGNRFQVTAQFTAPDGEAGNAHMVKLTDDSAYMWFFTSDNVEVVAKVLNGCALNDAYWFFAGGLTNVQVVINVTDSVSGKITGYHNDQGTAFQPIQDTSALAVCP